MTLSVSVFARFSPLNMLPYWAFTPEDSTGGFFFLFVLSLQRHHVHIPILISPRQLFSFLMMIFDVFFLKSFWITQNDSFTMGFRDNVNRKLELKARLCCLMKWASQLYYSGPVSIIMLKEEEKRIPLIRLWMQGLFSVKRLWGSSFRSQEILKGAADVWKWVCIQMPLLHTSSEIMIHNGKKMTR